MLVRLAALLLTMTCVTVSAQESFTRTATPWPDVPPPPKAQVQWVSDDMRVNGVPMKVQAFQSRASKDEVVAFYMAHWRIAANAVPDPAKPPASVTAHGPDTLVARAHGPYYSLVKVRTTPDGGSEGTISTSLLLGVEPRIDASGIPAPRSATPVNVVESIDNGKRNKQVMLVSREPLDSIASYYQTQLTASGWSLLQEQIASAKGSQGPAIVRMYGRDKQQLDVAMGVDAERRLTIVTVNLVKF